MYEEFYVKKIQKNIVTQASQLVKFEKCNLEINVQQKYRSGFLKKEKNPSPNWHQKI